MSGATRTPGRSRGSAAVTPSERKNSATPGKAKQPTLLRDHAGEIVDPVAVAAELEAMDAAGAIAWALRTFQPRLYFATSFQKTSSVIIDLAWRASPQARFFYLDTDLLFEETYTTRDALAARYGVTFDRYSGISLDQQTALYGDRLWDRQPDACCGIRKVEPMRQALSGSDCWVSGIRRVDSQTRAGAAKFGWDRRFGLWKLNPLADWTDQDVWKYINDNQLPYNPLHDAGYPSIGCTHCTRPPGNGLAARAGRWADAHKTECGLHG